ncbi:MAG: MFS transporter, partial [Gammaproteobacteria bacterium]
MIYGEKMTTTELQGSLALALIFFLRMLGLFLILPVFVLYADELQGATPTLIGIALGSYGLTQAMLQIPFGMLSDRLGRKPIITAGLMIFAIGSVVAGLADSITMVIVGRLLQGAGAIAAAIMALAADLTSEQQRTKSMALIGVSVGFAFALAFILGPVLEPIIGVPGLFLLSAVFALLAIAVLFGLVPTPPSGILNSRTETAPKQLGQVLSDRRLFHLDLSIFILHMLLMSNFVLIPLILRDVAGLVTADHWQVYLPVLLISALIMFPFLILGEKFNKIKLFFTGAVMLMMLSQFGFYRWHTTVQHIGLILVIFFTAFNYLEAILPSMITKLAAPTQKGTALGVYSTSQFIGTFVGGFAGGYIFEH